MTSRAQERESGAGGVKRSPRTKAQGEKDADFWKRAAEKMREGINWTQKYAEHKAAAAKERKMRSKQ